MRGNQGCLSKMNIEIRDMHPNEASEVSTLVQTVFGRYEAPDYSAEGVIEFQKYNTPQQLIERLNKNHFVLVAIANNRIVGMIEIRNHQHISLFFVHSEFHGQGIGKALWANAVERCKDSDVNANFSVFTVNSSPYAVSIYERLGFYKKSPEQVMNGIRFIPMSAEIK
jgi:ribosomal protein S18 acetylase RimI-like enzyme